MSDEVKNMVGDKPMNKTVDEIFMDRVGKIDSLEVYSSSTAFLMMFPNDYSVIAKMKDQRAKKVSVEVYYGIGEVTLDYFKNRRAAKKAKKNIVEALVIKLEAIKNDTENTDV